MNTHYVGVNCCFVLTYNYFEFTRFEVAKIKASKDAIIKYMSGRRCDLYAFYIRKEDVSRCFTSRDKGEGKNNSFALAGKKSK